MNLIKKGSYFLLLLFLSITISCDENDTDEIDAITGLDFVVATLSADGTKTGVVASNAFGNGDVVYTVDFGSIDDSDSDVFQTSGPMVTFDYPKETMTYTITVTATLEGAPDVTITKEHIVTYVDPTPVGGGGGNDANALLVGEWTLAPVAGALGVGPAKGDVSWWSSSADDVATRACLFDDKYVFNADGTFQNVLGADTWLEGWQGQDPEGCGTGVAPHDGSATATYTYDETAGTIKIEGKGSFLGLAKVNNAGELANTADAPDSITYEATLDGDTLTVDINFGPGYWSFKLVRPGVIGTWKLDPNAGALGVGPAKGDVSWWASSGDDVATRACLFDDEYVFNADGSFQNVLGSETWLEGWQGQDPEGCGAPVAPHNGAAATFSYDRAAGTLTLDGKGAFLGLAKVNNAGELANTADAPDSITYEVSFDGDKMIVDINFGPGYWKFVFLKQ